MKKIVSVLSVAALALSSIFAAEVTLSYKTKAALYKETNKKNVATDSDASQTRTLLDQTGYDNGKAKSNVVVSAKTDFAGFVLDFEPEAQEGKKGTAIADNNFYQYYGWLNFGPLQVTSGKWESRYGYELDDDQKAWADNDFNRYHLGIINGAYGHDVDNLTATLAYADSTKTFDPKKPIVGEKVEAKQQLATAVALTSHPNDGTYIMLKGVLVDSDWGSSLRLDSDRNYTGAYTSVTNGGDLAFHSGFAGEFAFHIDNSIDINVVAKSLKRDTLAIGAFVRPTFGSTTLLAGFTFGKALNEKAADGTEIDSTYSEFGIDLRLRTKLSDNVTLTTMHNISHFQPEYAKDHKVDTNYATMWNMVSLAYAASEKTVLQCTVQNECVLFKNVANDKNDGSDLKGPRTNGGYNLSIMPAVVYSFNENASLSAGLKWDINNIAALDAWKSTQGVITTSEFSIPVVFKVSL